MMHCQLPLLPLLGLLGALLLLGLHQTLEFPQIYKKLSLTDEGLQKVLAFTVPQFNRNRTQDANYFKMIKVEAMSRAYLQYDYHVDAYFRKTECKKTAGKTLTYYEIQQCKENPGKPQVQFCKFIVVLRGVEVKKSMNMTRCT